jgi:hypothetical protein
MRLKAADGFGLPRDLGHPAFAPLCTRVEVSTGTPSGTLGLAIPAPCRLVVAETLAGRAGALVLLRFGLELAALRAIPGLPDASATLLAGRAAGMFLGVLPKSARDAALEDPAVPLLARLSGGLPPIAQLAACWRMLAEATTSAESAPDLAVLRMVDRLWHLAAPAEALLVAGGDDRLTLSASTGLNRYLCAPYPMPGVIAFGSCTASIISEAAFAAAEDVRQDLIAASCIAPPETVLARASDQIVAELLVHLDVADIAEAVLAASGTDATLLLTGLLAAERPRETITTVLMSPSETGSGVPEAVQGRHFAPCTASGQVVEKGGAVDGFPPGLSLVSVALRDGGGLPRAPEDIAAECEARIEQALASPRSRVVLHAIDGSKTGLTAPGLLALDLLAERFGSRLDIVVDACQLRIEPALVRRYLERGWPVLITGSKFFGAPGFCGAVLFPRARLRMIAGGGGLPDGLEAYASLSDGTVSRRCPGLLLRWAAALAHMRPFADLSPADIRAAIDTAGAQIRAAMMREKRLRLVPAPRPEGLGWSDRPSVLTFTAEGPAGPLSAERLRPIYQDLARDMSGEMAGDNAALACLIGQPVQVTPHIGGLRLALSAEQIVAREDLRPRLAVVFGKLTAVLDR